jgi:hypothetical protein
MAAFLPLLTILGRCLRLGTRPGAAASRPRAARKVRRAPLLLLFLAAGCASAGPTVPADDHPPTGPAYQVIATWNNQVIFAPDPVHNGNPAPGLAGRLYLFGPQVDFPMEGDGGVVVDLYDESSGKPVMLEEWRFDKDTLKRLLRKDIIGWGYTLFLPWGTYRPDIQTVRLRLHYDAPGAASLYAESAPLTLSAGQDLQASSKSMPLSQAPNRGSGLRPAFATPGDAGPVVPAVAPGQAKPRG